MSPAASGLPFEPMMQFSWKKRLQRESCVTNLEESTANIVIFPEFNLSSDAFLHRNQSSGICTLFSAVEYREFWFIYVVPSFSFYCVMLLSSRKFTYNTFSLRIYDISSFFPFLCIHSILRQWIFTDLSYFVEESCRISV